MTGQISFRPARPSDAYALSELSILAGDGMYEFLLDEMAPLPMLAGLVSRTIRQEQGGMSWHNCFVADDKGVVGMVNAFPADWLRKEEQDVLPEERTRVLQPVDEAQDWESFLVNAIAVRNWRRRKGIGKHLLGWAREQAKSAGFDRLTANVWADNQAARGLFESQGFALKRHIEVPAHPGIQHVGGSLLYELTFG
jgi:GNAT superfamily N-acetyltransferase